MLLLVGCAIGDTLAFSGRLAVGGGGVGHKREGAACVTRRMMWCPLWGSPSRASCSVLKSIIPACSRFVPCTSFLQPINQYCTIQLARGAWTRSKNLRRNEFLPFSLVIARSSLQLASLLDPPQHEQHLAARTTFPSLAAAAAAATSTTPKDQFFLHALFTQ